MIGKRIARRMVVFGFALVCIAMVSLVLLIAFCSRSIEGQASGRLYSDAVSVPKRDTALVLGCVRILPNGRQNLYFRYRIQAAAELYHAGKVNNLIVSGDNGSKSYDEPSDMADALVALGVPEARIFKDYAGFRTLDSVVRAREIFGQDSLTIVSQAFHNERAIYLAAQNEIDAVGYNATDVVAMAGLRTKLREKLARVKTVLDVFVLRTQPRFLGPTVEIPPA